MKTPNKIRSPHWVRWGTLVRWTRKSLGCNEEVAAEMLNTHIEHGVIQYEQKDGVLKYRLPEVCYK